MKNQAQQKQNLEVWQIISSSNAGTVRQRTTTRGRQNTPSRGGTNTRQSVVPPYIASIPVRSNTRMKTTAQSTRRTAQNSSRTKNRSRTTQISSRTVQNRQRARAAAVQAAKKRRAKQRRARLYRRLVTMLVFTVGIALFLTGKFYYKNIQAKDQPEKKPDFVQASTEPDEVPEETTVPGKPKIKEDFLTISEYNRPGTELSSVKNIFVHYTANPKTSAAQNRSYFESLGQTHERAASAHFIIGCEGEIVQCIPLNEEAYAVIGRNNDSISIECCYISKDGSFTQETYDSLVHMLAWLLKQYQLDTKDILRHYDCGGKRCPLYFVEHEDAWEKLLYDVGQFKLE